MSLSNNFPTIAPSLNLDFANVKALDPRITFVRTTTGVFYDGKTTAKAEENLLLQSQDFTTAWVNFNSTDTANTEVAPDGTTTADTITDNATSGGHFVRQSPTIQINTPYVFSCFLKAGTSDYGYLGIQDGTTTERYFTADFDLSLGTVRTSAAGTSGTLTSSSITSVGNGWYRCVIVGQVSAMATANAFVGVSDGTTAINSAGAIPYVGTGSDIYAWGAQLEQRSAVTDYTPTTTQPITNYVPALQTAASGVARFDHNPTTFESLGLLIEESRTNLWTRSETFDTAAWAKTDSTITANTIVAPDGALTGDKLVEDATTANHFIAQSASVTSGTAYTASFYAKKAERTQCALLFAVAGFSTTTIDIFDLDNGTVVTNQSGTAAITPVGNDWYRVSTTRTATATASTSFQIRTANAGVTNYTGDGYSGIYIWGAQLEAGAFPTSYIPTTSASVTRNADAASMTGTNFSSWYRADEGTMYADYISGGATNRPIFIPRATSGESNRIQFGSSATNVLVNGVSQANIGSGTNITSGKHAFTYKVNDFASIIQGSPVSTSVNTDTSGNLPVVDYATIGHFDFGGGDRLNGTIKKIAYYPTRLSNAQLQALTTV